MLLDIFFNPLLFQACASTHISSIRVEVDIGPQRLDLARKLEQMILYFILFMKQS